MMAGGFLWDDESVLGPVWGTDATEWFKVSILHYVNFTSIKKKHSSG